MDDVFCSGIDLKEVASSIRKWRDALADWRDTMPLSRASSVFSAQVNGMAFRRCALTGVCDVAIAASDAAFGIPEVGFSMYPTRLASQMTLGRKRAGGWFSLLSAWPGTAEAWGLIHETVPSDALESRVNEIAARVGG